MRYCGWDSEPSDYIWPYSHMRGDACSFAFTPSDWLLGACGVEKVHLLRNSRIYDPTVVMLPKLISCLSWVGHLIARKKGILILTCATSLGSLGVE